MLKIFELNSKKQSKRVKDNIWESKRQITRKREKQKLMVVVMIIMWDVLISKGPNHKNKIIAN